LQPPCLGEHELGRVSKLVYSYVTDVNNGYILAKKGTLTKGDKVNIRGFGWVITDRKWLYYSAERTFR